MTEETKAEKIGEIEFKPFTFQEEQSTFIFNVWCEYDGSYFVVTQTHPKGAYNDFGAGRIFTLGEMIVLMRIFKHGKIISNDLPEKIMERAKREAILLKLQ